MDREYPPFSYEKGGVPAGFDVDILVAALSTDHVDILMKPMQWEQVQVELSAGSVHVTSGMVKTQKRLLLYDFPDLPNLALNVKLFTKASNRVGNVTLLRGKTVSVAKGTIYQRVLEDFGGLNIKLYKTELDALKALYNDDVEVFGGRDKTAMYYLEKLDMKGINAVGTPLYVTEVYFAVNKEQTKLLKMLNDGLRRIRENGEYDRIFRKWFRAGADPGRDQHPGQGGGGRGHQRLCPLLPRARGSGGCSPSRARPTPAPTWKTPSWAFPQALWK